MMRPWLRLEERVRRLIKQSSLSPFIAQIARLLLGTDLSVEQIALQAGHPNQAHLARFFSREMGMTPREYRKR